MAGQGQNKSDKESDFEFECPECGTMLHGNVEKCPKCGVEFEIEEVVEAECPECGKTVPVDAAECPACGAVFETGQKPPAQKETPDEVAEPAPAGEDEELKKQFPLLVSEVKPLMELAKEYDVESSECRGLIDRAVKAGKAKDLSTAVSCVQLAATHLGS